MEMIILYLEISTVCRYLQYEYVLAISPDYFNMQQDSITRLLGIKIQRF